MYLDLAQQNPPTEITELAVGERELGSFHRFSEWWHLDEVLILAKCQRCLRIVRNYQKKLVVTMISDAHLPSEEGNLTTGFAWKGSLACEAATLSPTGAPPPRHPLGRSSGVLHQSRSPFEVLALPHGPLLMLCTSFAWVVH